MLKYDTSQKPRLQVADSIASGLELIRHSITCLRLSSKAGTTLNDEPKRASQSTYCEEQGVVCGTEDANWESAMDSDDQQNASDPSASTVNTLNSHGRKHASVKMIQINASNPLSGVSIPTPTQKRDVMHPHHSSVVQDHIEISDKCMNESMLSIDSGAYSLWDEERDNENLHQYYCNRRNIILDSTNPLIAPHVVITPPEENCSDYYTPWQNRIPPQWQSYLMVPPYNILEANLLTLSEGEYGIRDPSASTCKKIFSKSMLDYPIYNTSEMLNENEIKNVLECRYKAVIMSAALEARKFRLRYDVPEHVSSVEKPFIWTDPAEPILHDNLRVYGATIIESPNSFTVPHILINEPPPQDPWIAWNNSIANPQDCGFGGYLTVPSKYVYSINATECHESSSYISNSTMDYSESELSSMPGTPELATPPTRENNLYTSDGGYFNQNTVLTEDVAWNCDNDDMHDSMPLCSASVLGVADPVDRTQVEDCQGNVAKLSPLIFEIEDEDDLPPFDEWYQEFSSREPNFCSR